MSDLNEWCLYMYICVCVCVYVCMCVCVCVYVCVYVCVCVWTVYFTLFLCILVLEDVVSTFLFHPGDGLNIGV